MKNTSHLWVEIEKVLYKLKNSIVPNYIAYTKKILGDFLLIYKLSHELLNNLRVLFDEVADHHLQVIQQIGEKLLYFSDDIVFIFHSFCK